MPLLWGWMIVAVVIALLFAALYGVRAASKAVAARYRAKRDVARFAAAGGHAPRAAKAGEKLGAAAAITVTGPGIAWRAFLDHWPKGWQAGKEWVRIKRDGPDDPPTQDPPTATRPAAPTPPAADPDPASRPTTASTRNGLCAYPMQHGQHCVLKATEGHPFCRHHKYVIEHPEEFAPGRDGEPRARTDEPTTKGPTTAMPIETRTNGEVLTQEQFKQELGAVIAEATAELEAAQNDLQAMTEDVVRVDTMVASLANAEIDSATRAAVMALAGTNAASQAAHRARVGAAEQRIAAAQNALNTFNAARQTKFHANAS